MNANALRSILLVRSVEQHDPDGALLPLAERDAATRDALREPSTPDRSPDARAWQVLASRAARLQAWLAGRHPVIDQALEFESALTTVRWLVLPAAFSGGVLVSLFDSRVRIEILAFPLLGVIAWNCVVYLVLLLSGLRRRRGPTASRSLAWPAWALWPAQWGRRRAADLARRSEFFHRPLSAALRSFSTQWWPVAQPMLAQQGQRLFHLGSAAIALGLVAGFYLRGLALEYRAGWESTFLGPGEVRALLGWVYGPASVATGIALPADATAMEALHWREGQGGGPAAPWIHLMAATAVLYVVIPRLLLALLATLRLARVSGDVPPPEALLGYARSVLGATDAALPPQVVRLTTFAYEPGEAAEQGLQRLLRAAFGADARIDFTPALKYGDEAALAARTLDGTAGIDALLFSLAATPEAENHGTVLRLARARTAASAAGSRLLVLVDESPYLARLGGDASLAARIEQRRTAWRDFVRGHGLEACLVDLAAVSATASVADAAVAQVQRSCRSVVA